MSRAYRIRVKESLTRDIAASDEICTDLELLEILSPEQTAALLREELKSRGFEEGEDGKMSRDGADGITVTVDPCSGEVSVKAESSDTVVIEGQKEGFGYDDVGPGEEKVRERLAEDLKKDLIRRAEVQEEKLQAKATEKLEGHLADLNKELGQIANRVTAEALKQKARSLGRIKEISEDPEAGSLTIKVEV